MLWCFVFIIYAIQISVIMAYQITYRERTRFPAYRDEFHRPFCLPNALSHPTEVRSPVLLGTERKLEPASSSSSNAFISATLVGVPKEGLITTSFDSNSGYYWYVWTFINEPHFKFPREPVSTEKPCRITPSWSLCNEHLVQFKCVCDIHDPLMTAIIASSA